MATFSHIPSPFRPSLRIEPQGGPPVFPASLEANDWSFAGDSTAMKRLRLQIRRIGPHFRIVLLHGESGTGKARVAHALHHHCAGTDGPFIVAASGNRIDYLMKIARCGTLFFNGIDEMPLETQEELLEMLRRNEWTQNGLAAPQKLSTRIVASTKQDLRGLVASGRFRQELHQRIAMVQITLPPLRERMEDVPELAMHFLDRLARRDQGKKLTITTDAMELLKSRSWPGNIEELKRVLEGAILQTKDGVIRAWELTIAATPFESSDTASAESAAEATRLQEVVDRHVLRVLRDCAGNKLKAAELLGISRSTLYRMLDSTPGMPARD